MKSRNYLIIAITALTGALAIAAIGAPRIAAAKSPINGSLPTIVKTECWLDGDKKICRYWFADGTSRDETIELGKTREGFIKPKKS